MAIRTNAEHDRATKAAALILLFDPRPEVDHLPTSSLRQLAERIADEVLSAAHLMEHTETENAAEGKGQLEEAPFAAVDERTEPRAG